MASYEYVQFLKGKILEYISLDRVVYQDRVNIRCPICGDSHKDARKKRGWVYFKPDNCSYYCFNCSTSMSGIKFLESISGQDYAEIKHEYAKLFLKSGLNTDLSSFVAPSFSSEIDFFKLKRVVKPEWKKRLSENAEKYLADRKVLEAPFLREDFYSWYSKTDAEYILIPWIVNGVECYYQLNDFMKHHEGLKYIFPKEMKKMIYGLDNIDMSWPYIICFEGVYDSLFVKNSVALGTKAITDIQVKLIKTRYPNHQICLSFDNDESGINQIKKYIGRDNDFKYFIWFDKNIESKDINEFILEKNDVNVFKDKNVLEKMIYSGLQTKFKLLN